MSEVRFIVPGEPKGWQRAGQRVVRKRTGEMAVHNFTQAQTRSHEAAVKWFAKIAMQGRPPMDCALEMVFTAFLPIPRSWSMKKQLAAEIGEIFPTGRPDLDNIEKGLKDAMNTVVYRDDALVVRVFKEKLYATEPRLDVMVRQRQPSTLMAVNG